MKKLIIISLAALLISTLSAQTQDAYIDDLLASSFELYGKADIELSYHIFPFLKKRFLKNIKDSASFYNPYDKLSKQISIRYSSDSLVKTYCWEERDYGCCLSTEAYAQYKTKSGAIKLLDLIFVEQGANSFITDLQMIEIDSKPYYLILGWGTCCGGKHYGNAWVYKIENEKLQKCDAIFNKEGEIYAGANRGQEIKMKYSPEQKILSYYSYGEMTDQGFYDNKNKRLVEWKLTEKGFEIIN